VKRIGLLYLVVDRDEQLRWIKVRQKKDRICGETGSRTFRDRQPILPLAIPLSLSLDSFGVDKTTGAVFIPFWGLLYIFVSSEHRKMNLSATSKSASQQNTLIKLPDNKTYYELTLVTNLFSN
jgi:hypothetical protein